MAGTPNLDEGDGCAVRVHASRTKKVEEQFRRGVYLLIHGQPDAARPHLEQVLRADPTHTPAGVNLSYLLLESGELAAAARVAGEVVATDPCEDKAWANLGTALLRAGHTSEAAGALTKARELDPYEPSYAAALGEIELTMEQTLSGIEHLTVAIRWGPDLWIPRLVLARWLVADRQYARATHLLEEATTIRTDRPDLWGWLGLARLGGGDVTGARKALETGLNTGDDPTVEALDRALALVPDHREQTRPSRNQR